MSKWHLCMKYKTLFSGNKNMTSSLVSWNFSLIYLQFLSCSSRILILFFLIFQIFKNYFHLLHVPKKWKTLFKKIEKCVIILSRKSQFASLSQNPFSTAAAAELEVMSYINLRLLKQVCLECLEYWRWIMDLFHFPCHYSTCCKRPKINWLSPQKKEAQKRVCVKSTWIHTKNLFDYIDSMYRYSINIDELG